MVSKHCASQIENQSILLLFFINVIIIPQHWFTIMPFQARVIGEAGIVIYQILFTDTLAKESPRWMRQPNMVLRYLQTKELHTLLHYHESYWRNRHSDPSNAIEVKQHWYKLVTKLQQSLYLLSRGEVLILNKHWNNKAAKYLFQCLFRIDFILGHSSVSTLLSSLFLSVVQS